MEENDANQAGDYTGQTLARGMTRASGALAIPASPVTTMPETGAADGESRLVLVAALLIGAIVWGLVWYPYRALSELGVSGEFASVITYVIALLLAMLSYRRQLAGLRAWPLLILIALTTGCCNVGFVLATVHGHVVRVVLLFYLAPAWTMVFAYLLLGERLSIQGLFLMCFALAGAMVMLWNPALGMPLPGGAWEWVALAAGVLFALSNVLLRRARNHTIEHRSLFIFAGCAAVALAACVLTPTAPPPVFTAMSVTAWALLAAIGIAIWSTNYAVQYGLGRVPANQAIVIYLSELVVAALSSWVLAGETLAAKEWIGGAMIVTASLLSGRLRPPAEPAASPMVALENA